MQSIELRFFAPEDNIRPRKQRTRTKPVLVTGYISPGGKLVLPQKAVIQLGFAPLTDRFKVGMEQGKRKVKSLYLVPVSTGEAGTFGFTQAAKSYTMPLGVILENIGVDYAARKHTFTVVPFDFEAGVTGYEFRFDEPADKPVYTGKKRGPKPKAVVA